MSKQDIVIDQIKFPDCGEWTGKSEYHSDGSEWWYCECGWTGKVSEEDE